MKFPCVMQDGLTRVWLVKRAPGPAWKTEDRCCSKKMAYVRLLQIQLERWVNG